MRQKKPHSYYIRRGVTYGLMTGLTLGAGLGVGGYLGDRFLDQENVVLANSNIPLYEAYLRADRETEKLMKSVVGSSLPSTFFCLASCLLGAGMRKQHDDLAAEHDEMKAWADKERARRKRLDELMGR